MEVATEGFEQLGFSQDNSKSLAKLCVSTIKAANELVKNGEFKTDLLLFRVAGDVLLDKLKETSLKEIKGIPAVQQALSDPDAAASSAGSSVLDWILNNLPTDPINKAFSKVLDPQP